MQVYIYNIWYIFMCLIIFRYPLLTYLYISIDFEFGRLQARDPSKDVEACPLLEVCRIRSLLIQIKMLEVGTKSIRYKKVYKMLCTCILVIPYEWSLTKLKMRSGCSCCKILENMLKFFTGSKSLEPAKHHEIGKTSNFNCKDLYTVDPIHI